MSTAVSHLRQYCCCSATVIYYYVRPCDVGWSLLGRRWAGPALTRQLNPFYDSLTAAQMNFVNLFIATLSICSWIFFCQSFTCFWQLSLSAVDESNEHLLHYCMMQYTELCLKVFFLVMCMRQLNHILGYKKLVFRYPEILTFKKTPIDYVHYFALSF